MSEQAMTDGPMENEVHKCQYCDALIWFGRTVKGKNMPLEAKPARAYRCVKPTPGKTQTDVFQLSVYLPHWATCPGANAARLRNSTTPPPAGREKEE